MDTGSMKDTAMAIMVIPILMGTVMLVTNARVVVARHIMLMASTSAVWVMSAQATDTIAANTKLRTPMKYME